MFRFKRDDTTEFRTECTYCGGEAVLINNDPSCRVMKCKKCKTVFDGVAEKAERTVYEKLKRTT